MVRSNPSENQGGETPFDSLGSSSRSGSGTAGLNVDRSALRDLTQGVRSLGAELKTTAAYAKDLVASMGRIGGGGGGRTSMLGGSGGGRTNMPMAGTVAASAAGGGGGGRISVPTAGGGPGGGGGGPGGGGGGGEIGRAHV